ncbi:MAG: nucleotidyltransferase family protein [Candidatus Omnitrophota bacterium]
MRILILSAGYGTRLYPLTLNLPKSLVPVYDRPLMNFLIEKINVIEKKFPVKNAVIVSNNKFYKDFVSWKKKYKVKVGIVNDGSNTPEDRLGAVRDIEFGIAGKDDDWLILGGDNLFEDKLLGFIDFAYKKNSPCVGVYDVKNKKSASRYGIIKTDKNKRIIKFEEKPKKPFSTLAATCIYFFPKKSIKFLNMFLKKEKAADAAGKYIKWLITKTEVYGYVFSGNWTDIGHIDSLMMAEKKYKAILRRENAIRKS